MLVTPVLTRASVYSLFSKAIKSGGSIAHFLEGLPAHYSYYNQFSLRIKKYIYNEPVHRSKRPVTMKSRGKKDCSHAKDPGNHLGFQKFRLATHPSNIEQLKEGSDRGAYFCDTQLPETASGNTPFLFFKISESSAGGCSPWRTWLTCPACVRTVHRLDAVRRTGQGKNEVISEEWTKILCPNSLPWLIGLGGLWPLRSAAIIDTDWGCDSQSIPTFNFQASVWAAVLFRPLHCSC